MKKRDRLISLFLSVTLLLSMSLQMAQQVYAVTPGALPQIPTPIADTTVSVNGNEERSNSAKERFEAQKIRKHNDDKDLTRSLEDKLVDAFRNWLLEDELTESQRGFVDKLLANNSFSQFSTAEKEQVEEFLRVDFSALLTMEEQGLTLEQIADVLELRRMFDLDMTTEVLPNLNYLKDSISAMAQLQNYEMAIPAERRTAEVETAIRGNLLKGATLNQAVAAYALKKEFNADMNSLLSAQIAQFNSKVASAPLSGQTEKKF